MIKDRRPRILGVRSSSLIEIGIYLGVALALDYFVFAGDRFRDISPHPFWGIVLLMAVQYGTSEALIAAGAASIALLAGNIPQQTVLQDTYQYLFRLAKDPLLWITSAIVFGELRMRHIHQRLSLERDLAAATERMTQYQSGYDRLLELKTNLEARIAGQFRTAINIYRAARTLDRTEPSEVLMGVMEIMNAVMGPKKFSLYLLSEDALEISMEQGWKAGDAYSRSFHSTSHLFKEVVGQQRVLCAANAQDEAILGAEGVLAGPLVDDETGDIVGMLKIEELHFLDLHLSNVQTFKAICEWIAHSYLSARDSQVAEAEALINSKTRIMTHTYFERQRDFLIKLGQRVGFDISMIVMRIENPAELGEARADTIPVMITGICQGILRTTDLLFEQRAGSYEYCVMLPNTTVENAFKVVEKLKGRLAEEARQTLPDARFSLMVQSVYQTQANNVVENHI